MLQVTLSLVSLWKKEVFIRPQKGVITISKHVSTLALKLASCFQELPHLFLVFFGIWSQDLLHPKQELNLDLDQLKT